MTGPIEVCVDEHSQLGYRLEMCVNNTAASIIVNHAYNPYRLKSLDTCQCYNGRVVFNFLLYDKTIRIAGLDVLGKFRCIVQVVVGVFKAIARIF